MIWMKSCWTGVYLDYPGFLLGHRDAPSVIEERAVRERGIIVGDGHDDIGSSVRPIIRSSPKRKGGWTSRTKDVKIM